MKLGLLVLGVALMVGVLWLVFMSSTTVTNVPSSGTTVVAFGDSLIAGVGASEGNDLVSILSDNLGESIVNLGRPGDTTQDALNRIDSVVEQNPMIVIVLLGGNDYLQRVPETTTFANLEQIIQTIHQSGSAVLLLGVRGGVLQDNYKDQFAAVAKKHNTAYVSDVLAGILGKQQLMSDLVHPNDAGYRLISQRVQPELEKLLE